jgi:REP element-mobilizing transposase RayT
MARPPRIEFSGALYHVTSRGDRREPIFVDNFDRNALLDVLADGLARLDANVLAYCLMGNHYHLVVHTRQANLSQLMRHVNGVYTQRFNRRHGLVGHLFQGRFKAILVDRQSYLLEVCRYVDLNPVRAGLVAQPADWPWSSYAAHTGMHAGPPWLDSQALWSTLLGDPATTPAQAALGAGRYADLVRAAPGLRLWDEGVHRQLVLGSEAFAERVLAQAGASQPGNGPRHKPEGKPLQVWLSSCATREQAFWNACHHGGYTMTRIASEVGLSVQQVSRLVARWNRRAGEQVKGET